MEAQAKSKVSKTAQGTCLMRAVSYYEKEFGYKSEDFIAPTMLPSCLQASLKYHFIRSLVKKNLFKVPGIYEYVISRTHFIDEIFKNHTKDIEQVLIFGAGFDSRSIRFANQLQHATIFELDAPLTQQVKRDKLARKNISIPQNVKFIAMDFNKDALVEKLAEGGFAPNRCSLFVLEGLTYYLMPEAIASTFHFISNYAGADSLLVFDYVNSTIIQEKMQNDTILQKNYQVLVKAGERPDFMMGSSIQDFLKPYHFNIIEEVDSAKMAKRYFNKEDFALAAKMYRMVLAKKI